MSATYGNCDESRRCESPSFSQPRCDKPIILTHLPSCAIPINQTSSDRRCNDDRRCAPYPYYQQPYYSQRCLEEEKCFYSIITPMVNLIATESENGSQIEFEMTRVGRDVSLQWEPFTGAISQTGVEYLSVPQSISWLPKRSVDLPIKIVLRGTARPSFVRIQSGVSINIKIYLDNSGSGASIVAGDSVYVPGGCVNWIARKEQRDC